MQTVWQTDILNCTHNENLLIQCICNIFVLGRKWFKSQWYASIKCNLSSFWLERKDDVFTKFQVWLSGWKIEKKFMGYDMILQEGWCKY